MECVCVRECVCNERWEERRGIKPGRTLDFAL